ncbi:hypothetical protein SH501x_005236 [Pirellulaceae bacterium SH501]
MNQRIQQLLLGSDSRYLSAEEKTEFSEYLERTRRLIDVLGQIEENEDTAVRFCIDNTRKRYPNFDKYHTNAWAKAFRDVQLTTRYMAQAMLLSDMKILEDKLLYWLRTILSGFSFTPEFNRDTYTYLKQGFRQALPPDVFEEFEPYLDRSIEILSDFPNPAVPAV